MGPLENGSTRFCGRKPHFWALGCDALAMGIPRGTAQHRQQSPYLFVAPRACYNIIELGDGTIILDKSGPRGLRDVILETRPMKSTNGRRTWIPPTVTKLAIRTQTKSPIEVAPRLEPLDSGSATCPAAEPQLPRAPAAKFGFSLEWSFPLAVRTD